MAFDNANQAKGSTGQPASCRPRVLVSERDSRVRIALSRCLETLACEVVATTTAKDALAAIEHRPFDLAFVDPAIEIEAGHDLGSRVLDETPETLLVLIVSCTTFGAALPERLRGMCDHLPDVFSPGQVRRLVEAFREEWGLRQQLADCRRHLRAVSFDCGIVAEISFMNCRPFILTALLPLFFGGCLNVKTAPIEVKPIHITVDVNVKVERALDDFFGDLDKKSATIETPKSSTP